MMMERTPPVFLPLASSVLVCGLQNSSYEKRIIIKSRNTKLSGKGGRMTTEKLSEPSPRRVAAGRLNQLKCKGLTPAGRERVRQAALRDRPWQFSTGPRTTAGKAKVALNGKRRQLGLLSIREIRRNLAEYRGLLEELRDSRAMVSSILGQQI
jgi:hypothetical protein